MIIISLIPDYVRVYANYTLFWGVETGLCSIEERIQGLEVIFKDYSLKKCGFQGFQGLEIRAGKFKYFQALQGPVRTLLAV